MLVQIGPLQGIALAKHDNVLPLCLRRMKQSRIPVQGDGQDSPVDQRHDESIGADLDLRGSRLLLKHQSCHAILPERGGAYDPAAYAARLADSTIWLHR